MYGFLHRYQECIDALRQALVLAPDVAQSHLSIGWAYVRWTGELDTLRAALKGLPLDADPGMGGDRVWYNLLRLLVLERRPDSVLAVLRVVPAMVGQSAGRRLSRALWVAPALTLRGDTAGARATADSAAVLLDAEERANPDDWEVHVWRGRVLGWLGRRTDVLREARWLAQSDQYRKDRYENVTDYALLLMLAGETDAALVEIERQLAAPSNMSVAMLRLDPDWDPIRTNPRFQALLAKYATVERPR